MIRRIRPLCFVASFGFMFCEVLLLHLKGRAAGMEPVLETDGNCIITIAFSTTM